MKYMGSKRYALSNGLGEMICDEARSHERIVDLFTGSGSVAWFAAEQTDRPVLAVDLQTFACVLAASVIGRVKPVDVDLLATEWLAPVAKPVQRSRHWASIKQLETSSSDTKELVDKSRKLCSTVSRIGPVWNAYGGYYFSPSQAMAIDYMLKLLPTNPEFRNVCLAALVAAASRCVAAPGHTAQPFQPTMTAESHLRAAWSMDPVVAVTRELNRLCPRYAQTIGEVRVANGVAVSRELCSADLVIVDPPYSAVHYSRFYHVLETIAVGRCGQVSGTGRYPPVRERPRSDFSMKTTVVQAFTMLLNGLADAGATVILTFPFGMCSTGISGSDVLHLAEQRFTILQKEIIGRFSTLGGNDGNRGARTESRELLLRLRPK